ncbi:hypothetical protein SAMN05216275_1872 [Streptosporangium canum]|uniref:Uncharacterized protein n=1 Tax=Streptosporangium canum TaxID=324952 RepID=A0A1I4G2W8_9ACTN|nr:hypothetical protein SAMN05216275_1872 [Streptosporangium canum]
MLSHPLTDALTMRAEADNPEKPGDGIRHNH